MVIQSPIITPVARHVIAMVLTRSQTAKARAELAQISPQCRTLSATATAIVLQAKVKTTGSRSLGPASKASKEKKPVSSEKLAKTALADRRELAVDGPPAPRTRKGKRAAEKTNLSLPPVTTLPDAAKTKHGQIAFDRHELQAVGSLELADAHAPTLANKIHWIWQKRNFRPVSDATEAEFDAFYGAIEPALRLATMWLTQVEYRNFWGTLMAGRVKATTVEMIWPESIPPHEWPRCLAQIEVFLRNHHHDFTFRPLPYSWALTEPQDTIFRRSRTVLHEEFFYVGYRMHQVATASQQLRYLFLFAMQLVEQLAHVIYQKRRLEENFAEVIKESIGFVHVDAARPHLHLGIAWEQLLLGGRLQILNHAATPLAPYGLALLPMDMVRGDPFKDSQRRISALPMDWINRIFSQEWWTEVRQAPERPRLPSVRATVNRLVDQEDFHNNTYESTGYANGEDKQVRGIGF